MYLEISTNVQRLTLQRHQGTDIFHRKEKSSGKTTHWKNEWLQNLKIPIAVIVEYFHCAMVAVQSNQWDQPTIVCTTSMMMKRTAL